MEEKKQMEEKKWEALEEQMENRQEQEDESEEIHPELYTEEEMDQVEKHICKYFGEFSEVFHEIVSPDIHVDICIIPPSKEKNYYTLVTMGMGAHRMNVPKELAEFKLERGELLVTLPPDWKLNRESMADERWYWPIRMLKFIARLPGEDNTWLGWGHTVTSADGKAYAENTKLCAAILVDQLVAEEDAAICELPGGEEVNFYQLIPLYEEEVAFKCENSAEELLDMMEDLSFVVDIERRNVMENAEEDENSQEEEYSVHVTLNLNARFQPVDRHELEDVLEMLLEKRKVGIVDGGGTMQMPTGEIEYCDIELYLKEDTQEIRDVVSGLVQTVGVPKGSKLIGEGWEETVGTLEGMALYMNGTELDDQVYENCDINYAAEQMEKLMEGLGRIYSYWEGPNDTALYFYGSSYEKMLAAIQGFLDEYPLCQKCIVKQIA